MNVERSGFTRDCRRCSSKEEAIGGSGILRNVCITSVPTRYMSNFYCPSIIK